MREREERIQYIWANRLLKTSVFKSTENQSVEIISWGVHNILANGPDFNYAAIRFLGLIWHGHIEVHINSSDWFSHRHHFDPQYNNVILHVVRKHDLSDSSLPFPTIILHDDLIIPFYRDDVKRTRKRVIICEKHLTLKLFNSSVDPISLFQKRFLRKTTKLVTQNLQLETIVGFGKNTNTPLFRFISENWQNSGLKIVEFINFYKDEVSNLQVTKRSYSNAKLSTVLIALENFMLLFPSAYLICKSRDNAVEKVSTLMNSEWAVTNKSQAHFLLINIWLPFFLKNSLITWNEAIEILKTLPPDDNGIINLWKQFGIKPCNAYDSQVLLEIYSELCENKKCLNCPIGKVLLK